MIGLMAALAALAALWFGVQALKNFKDIAARRHGQIMVALWCIVAALCMVIARMDLTIRQGTGQ